MVQECDLAGQQAARAEQRVECLEEELWWAQENLHKKMRAAAEESAAAAATSRPDPKFRAGQSVHHWWGNWFESALEVPRVVNKQSRPKWYVSEVMERSFPTQAGL